MLIQFAIYEPLRQGGNPFRPASDRSLLLNTAAAQIASPDSNDADNEEEGGRQRERLLGRHQLRRVTRQHLVFLNPDSILVA